MHSTEDETVKTTLFLGNTSDPSWYTDDEDAAEDPDDDWDESFSGGDGDEMKKDGDRGWAL